MKNVLPVLIALGMLSLMNCRKDSEPIQSTLETGNTVNQSASDRAGCSRMVTLFNGFGLQVCGSQPYVPGNLRCNNCDAIYTPITKNVFIPVTYAMQTDCFTLSNPTGASILVTVQVGGQSCSNNTYNIAAGSSLRLCITELAECCQTVATDCPVIGPGGKE